MPQVLNEDAFDQPSDEEAAEQALKAQQAALVVSQAPRAAEADPKPTEALKTRKTVSTRNITLEDGRVVVISKPSKPVNLHLARMMGRQSNNPTLLAYYRTLMHVRSVDGMPIPFINEEAGFDTLSQLLGDDSMDELAYAVQIEGFEVDEDLDKDQVKN